MLNHIILIFLYIIFKYKIIKCENINIKGNNNNLIYEKFPEFKNVSFQRLLMVSPSDQCNCHQKTVFFKYPSFIEQNYHNYNITEFTIREKEYFVGAVQQFSDDIKSKLSVQCIENTLKNNNIIRLYHLNDTNLFWKNRDDDLKRLKYYTNIYQKYNNILKHSEITDKELLYVNYENMKKNFPNDFDYMPKTYTKNDIDYFKKNLKNYRVSKDNLWLVKPKRSTRGKNIFFLKNISDIKKNDIVTKYISNPLLINNRKFDIRLYLLVTGNDPLKVYIFQEGLVRLSADNYDLDLNDLDNLFKHLTNTSINKNNKKGYGYDDLVMSIADLKEYLKITYKIDFIKIWNQIKDISIKSLISMNHIELKKEKDFKLHSNNLFKLLGIDIIIDDNFKAWLLEINHGPSLGTFKSKNHAKITKYQLVHDMFNIIGLIPYSHLNGNALEGECKYEDFIEESLDQSICEFTRPHGGFEQIFPLKSNVQYYKKFFKNISPNNKALWDRIKRINLNNNKINGNCDNKNVILNKKKLKNIKNRKKLENVKLLNDYNKLEENKNDMKYKNISKEEIIKTIFPQFGKKRSQKLLMLSPSPQCKNHQRTIFFKYPSFLGNNLNDKVEELIINDMEYFVGDIQSFNHNVSPISLKRTLNNNGIIRLYKENDGNLYWRSTRRDSIIPQNINKYQRYNHMLMFHEITRKHLLYKNYLLYKKQFSDEFNYMPETYTSETFEEFKQIFKNYKISKDNLWLIKPKNSSLGKGIRFLKNINDVKKDEIVAKYISNSLLINGRKFDLRFHVLVTGHNPLKVYIHTNGFAKVSSEYYDLDNLDNLFKHITNIAFNKKNKNKYNTEDYILSFEKVKEYLRKTYNLNFSEIEDEVNDIVIKSLITMNHLELEKEKNYQLSSNNIFDLYGVDIIIDSHFKPWLVEINVNPTLGEENLTKDRKKMLRQTLNDVFNIIGLVPFSHFNATAFEGESKFKDCIDEAVQQSICEFTRPLGGFKRIFPLKSNIDYYKKYFKEISSNNQALWDEIQ